MSNDDRMIELLEQVVAGLARIEKSQARIEQAQVPLTGARVAQTMSTGFADLAEKRRAAAEGGDAA